MVGYAASGKHQCLFRQFREQLLQRQTGLACSKGQNAAVEVKTGYGIQNRPLSLIDGNICRKKREHIFKPGDPVLQQQYLFRPDAPARLVCSGEHPQHHGPLGYKLAVAAGQVTFADLVEFRNARVLRVGDRDA